MNQSQLDQVLEIVREINKDEFKIALTSSNDFESLLQELTLLKDKISSDKAKSLKILDHLTHISSGDFTHKIEIEEGDSLLDAISYGINVFSEEIESSMVSQEEFKDTLNALPYIVWASNIDFTKVLYINNSVQQIFGVDSMVMLENKNLWVDLIHPEDRKYVEDAFDDFMLTGEFSVKYRLIRPDNQQESWILDQAKFLYNEKGERYRIVGSCKDITYEQNYYLELQQTNQKLVNVHNIARLGHWEVKFLDGKSVISSWPSLLREIFEMDENIPNEEIFNLFRQAVLPEYHPVLAENHRKAVEEKLNYEFDYEIDTLKTKTRKYLRTFAEPILNSMSEVIGISGITQDITDKHKQELAIKNAYTRLEEAQSMSKIGSWEWNVNTHELIWSKEHFNIFEIDESTDKNILYQVYRDKIQVDDLMRLDKCIEKTVTTGESFNCIHRAILGNGKIKYVRGIGNAIKNENGEIIALQGTAQDITEEKVQENKLNFALDNLNAILDATDYSIISTNFEGTITLMNKGAERMLGFAAEELVNKFSPEIIHDLDEVKERAKELTYKLGVNIEPGIDVFHFKPRELGISYEENWSYIRKDGSKVPVNLTVNAVRDKNNQVTGYLGIAKDMTYENVRNAEMIAIKTELQNFFDLTSDCMCIANIDGRFKTINNTFVTVLGYSKEELVGSLFTDLIHPEDINATYQEIEKLANGAVTIDFENRFRKKDGDYVWLSWRTAPDVKTGDLYATARDITLKRQQEQELKTALAMVEDYQTALNQIAIVSISDVQGNITFANEMFSKISGYSNDELIGKNHRILKSDQNESSLFDDLWKTISSGKTWRGDICNKNKFGELYWVDTLIVPFVGEDGKPEQYFSIRYEITEKKTQEHLQEANKILLKEKEIAESNSKLKERFLANMSHEIRTPMNSILGLSNLMEKVGTLNPKQMDYVQTIKLNSKNLLNIINDILDLSKIEEGKLEMEHAEFDVVEIISTIEKSLHPAASNKNIDLVTSIDTSVPRKIIGDSTRLNQVLTNLVNNAIKFTNQGSVCIGIETISLSETKVTLRFSIKDTGIGIQPDKLKSIFEPFTQEKSSTTRLYGGTGLGLTISNEIIHAFGGQIEVQSKPNEGSEFFFVVSFEIPSSSQQKEMITTNDEVTKIELIGKYSILLLEDNPFNQMVAEDTLKDWNGELEIVIAENGEEALEKLKEQRFDLVLMDIQMPVMDGHTAAMKARKELNITTPILAMTAQATPAEIEACMLSGMNDYVSKPFDEKVLFAKIVKWIGSDLLL